MNIAEQINEIIAKIRTRFEVWETIAGVINVYIFDPDSGECIGAFGNFEYLSEGRMLDVLKALADDADEYESWDNTMTDYYFDSDENEDDITPDDIYYDMMAHCDHSYNLVCDNRGIYPEYMGGSADEIFGIPEDWETSKGWWELGQTIAYYRKERHLIQRQLAEMVNVSRTHMSRIENSDCAVSLDMIFSLAKALDIPVYKLFEFR